MNLKAFMRQYNKKKKLRQLAEKRKEFQFSLQKYNPSGASCFPLSTFFR